MTVEKAPELVEFVKQAFGATEIFRTTGSAGGMHAEVRIGESMLMIGWWSRASRSRQLRFISICRTLTLSTSARCKLELRRYLLLPIRSTVNVPAPCKTLPAIVWYIATPFETAEWPEELRTVTVYFHPIGASGLIDFLKNAFGAEEVGRPSIRGRLRVSCESSHRRFDCGMGEARDPSQPMPTAIYLYVEDVDAMYDRALKAGGTSMLPPTDQPYGDRNAWVEDPFGNIWYLATTIGTTGQ